VKHDESEIPNVLNEFRIQVREGLTIAMLLIPE
jgi:hypothetical protein